ncbi:MAG: redox-sensing transcriptional repressor Rex [Candidatus Promineifilaceae bacterium]
MTESEIPDIVIGRLPMYLRELNQMANREALVTTSSQELGRRLGISSAQIRKDLSHFGEFGKQGTGYHINYLVDQLQQILHLTREWPVAVIGAGYLGHALANYKGFQQRGFRVVAVFDADPAQIGEEVGGLVVESIDDLEQSIREKDVRMVILALPREAAQEITDRLVEVGVRALLSYVPVHLAVPDGVQVSYSDPVVQMQRMTYYLDP